LTSSAEARIDWTVAVVVIVASIVANRIDFAAG
jgi:hypothetical protein